MVEETLESKLIDAYVETFNFWINNQSEENKGQSFTKKIIPWYNKKITLANGFNSKYINEKLIPQVNNRIEDYFITSIKIIEYSGGTVGYEILFTPKSNECQK